MTRTLLLALLVIGVAFAGCFGGGDDDTGPGPDGDDDGDGPDGGDGGNGTVDVTASRLNVTLTEVPDNASADAPINVSWRVDTGADVEGDIGGGNNTGVNASAGPEQRALNETGVAWSFTSVPDPENVSDYEDNVVAASDVTAPGEWNATFTPSGNASAGGNASANASLYVRAYAIDDNGTVAWSPEAVIPYGSEQAAEHEVTIGGLGGPMARYDPPSITIAAGDSVVWTNNDPLGLAHTATSREGPEEFDTGQISGGSSSEPIVFTVPGTYVYACDNHPTMAEATIIVTAGNGTK